METQAVSLKNIEFKIKDQIILQSITESIAPKTRALLLGPNGSGKSTLLKIIGAALKADGEVTLFGKPADSIAAKEKRLFIPQQLDFPAKLTIKELIHFICSHFRHPTKPSILNEWLKQYLLNPNVYAMNLSCGQKKRLAILLAFIIQPSLLLLDEPEVGVDLQFRDTMLKEVLSRDPARTVVITTHAFDGLIDLIDRVLILKQGRLIFADTITSFLQIQHRLQRWDLFMQTIDPFIEANLKSQFRTMRFGEHSIRVYVDEQSECLFHQAKWMQQATKQEVTVNDIYFYLVGDS